MWPALQVLAPITFGSFMRIVFLKIPEYGNETFLLPSFSRRHYVSLHLRSEKILRALHPMHWKCNCIFNRIPLLKWKYKTHFLWSTATQKPRKFCSILKHDGEFSFPFCFFVRSIFVCIHRVSVNVHNCSICARHWPQRGLKTGKFSTREFLKGISSIRWGCQLLEVECGNVPPAN